MTQKSDIIAIKMHLNEHKKRCKSVASATDVQEQMKKQEQRELRSKRHKSVTQLEQELFGDDDESDLEVLSILSQKKANSANTSRQSPFVTVGNCRVVETFNYRQDYGRVSRNKVSYGYPLELDQYCN